MLSGCGGANELSNIEPEGSSTTHSLIKGLSDDEIKANLSESDDFWLLVSPQQFENPAQAYALNNVNILSHETTEECEEFIVTADAESPFAVYSGNFIVKYTGDKKDGYTLNLVYQDYAGAYEITALPTEEIVEEWFMRPSFIPPSYETNQKGKLLSASVYEIKDCNSLCEVQYDQLCQLDEYCNVKELLSCYCKFENGIWNVTSELSRKPEINYIYDLPPVSSQEIADAIASIDRSISELMVWSAGQSQLMIMMFFSHTFQDVPLCLRILMQLNSCWIWNCAVRRMEIISGFWKTLQQMDICHSKYPASFRFMMGPMKPVYS